MDLIRDYDWAERSRKPRRRWQDVRRWLRFARWIWEDYREVRRAEALGQGSRLAFFVATWRKPGHRLENYA